MAREQLLSPLSAQEISTIVGNIQEVARDSGADAAGITAVQATVRGLREWCGEKEVTIAMLSLAGLAPRPADLVAN